ncbi:EAL domain-containing protein [Roseibium hamelinense]|nr:EAL domain-containing protein [Roseibium hamelinense]MTI42301.1 EAL domain-containing protein [Roseibium hamelinense]
MPHSGISHTLAEFLFSFAVCFTVAGFAAMAWQYAYMRRQFSKQRRAHREAMELAQHDALTGLPNRRKFEEVFPAMTSSIKVGHYRGIMMLDVDGFKPINDVYGHAFGDNLLKSFAERLAAAVGPDGLVARLGGDEFAIVTPELADKSEAAGIARRILTKIQESFELGARKVSVGTGIGITIFPDDGYSATELLRRADIALYRAKTSGRSSFRFFEVDMDASILHRTLLEQRLRAAIKKNEVQAHYQPILDLTNQTIVGFEALARWNDRDFGQVAPKQFIPIAEDCGIITDLTEHLLRAACKVAKTWPDHMCLNFNISPVQLQDTTLPLKVISILSETGLAPDRLVLEITETSLLKNPMSAKTILEQLTAARISIALDDFGTGHSSLSYLRDFPIQKVKIDKSFTLKMNEDKESAAIVEAILILADGLNIDVVAEGIEQPEILQKLNSQGCHYGQGFLFGAAKSAEGITTLLQNELPDNETVPEGAQPSSDISPLFSDQKKTAI